MSGPASSTAPPADLAAPAPSFGGLPRAWVLACLALGVALRLVVMAASPLRMEVEGALPAYNDEFAHFRHVAWRAEHPGTPPQHSTVREPGAVLRGDYEFYQPPLHYELSAVVWNGLKPLGADPRWLRILSLLLWAAALAAALAALPRPAMRPPVLLAGTVLGVSLVPSATINNDAMFALYAAMLYLLAARAASGPLTARDQLVLAAAMAGAVYAKLAALTLIPMGVAAAFLGTPGPRRRLLAPVLHLAALGLLTLPLWIARQQVYGSPLATDLGSGGSLGLDLRTLAVAFVYNMHSPWQELWPSYFVKVPSALFAAALLASAVLAWRRRRAIAELLRDAALRRTTILWGIGGLGAVAGWSLFALRYHQVDPRLLLPAALPLAVAFGWPFWAGPERWRAPLAWALLALVLLPHLAWL